MKTTLITLDDAKARELQQILDSGRLYDCVKSGDTIAVFTAEFGGGFSADIKVVNGEPPYIDAVLFKNGCEVYMVEPHEFLLGVYVFECLNKEFRVRLLNTDSLKKMDLRTNVDGRDI